MRKNIIVVVIILLLIFIVFTYQFYLKKESSDDDITYDEFLNDIEMDWGNRTIDFESYNPGDEVKIRDEIKGIEVRYAHIIDLNISEYMFSNVLPTNVTYTIIFLKSVYKTMNPLIGTFDICLEGDRSQEFKPNNSNLRV